MRYREMSGQDRRAIFEPARNYPLRITLDGETREMDRAEVEALRLAGRDFDVAEDQVARILTEQGAC